ncbi:alpha-1,2-fucosyltransferase [Arcobacter sp.]|uniref:alpha-1,2-fucosyltransferase n=1 Tax=Arcobacter sp. TaxID=1872629 RepID=UPI003D0CFB62
MIILKLQGGLGNQLFQVALGITLSKTLQKKLTLSLDSFKDDKLRNFVLDKYKIEYNIISQDEINKLIPYITINEKKFNYHKLPFLDNSQVYYINGYWQSEKYFLNNKDLLKNLFKPKEKLQPKALFYKKLILNSNSISIHVRRGDYISSPVAKRILGNCSLKYYKNSFLYLKKDLKELKFFIFSDDILWCKKNFKFIKNKVFIEKTLDYEELFLMSQCKHNIIANSTFSWWAAWLNENKNKIIIAPNKWFNDKSMNDKDLIPKEWKKM